MLDRISNLRLLCTPSENLGQDWMEKSFLINELIQTGSFTLAEENVYLIFNKGQCLVGKSIVGSKKNLAGEFVMQDLDASGVVRKRLKSLEWARVWPELKEMGLEDNFTLCLRRDFEASFNHWIEVILKQ